MVTRGLRTFSDKGTFVAGALMLVAILVTVLWLPTPHPPNLADPSQALLPPGGDHLLGTDALGRDVASRVLAGGRTDVPLTLWGTLVCLAIGIPVGLVASTRGRLAEVTMRFLDLLQAFPLLILAILFVALSQDDRGGIILAIVLVGVPQLVRIVRNDALIVRQKRFVESATAMGSPFHRTFLRHVVPNLLSTLVAQTSLIVGGSLSVIAALTFLGFGIKPPAASWGSMVREGLAPLQAGAWWVSTVPAVAVFLTIVAANLFAAGVRRLADA
jgi:peptide/nickel transport system permease protein